MTLDDYKQYYVIDEGHWYVSKIKQYTPESYRELAKALKVFSTLLTPDGDKNVIDRYYDFVDTTQGTLFQQKRTLIPICTNSSLFLSLLILTNDLVDMSHLRSGNNKKYVKFLDIRKEFIEGKKAIFFKEKYTETYLNSQLEIYFRNFYSWLSKFGFLGKDDMEITFITEIGYEFIKASSNIDLCNAIFLHQIKRVQVWNPTIDHKYKDFKVIPYYLILEILTKLPDNYFTKKEYVLFITKTKSHNPIDIDQTIALIKSFRKLSQENKNKYIKSIEILDKKLFPNRERTNYTRLLDSSHKEISAYASSNLTIIGEGGYKNTVRLNPIPNLQSELTLFNSSPQYIEFSSKYDWIWHLGNLNGFSIEQIIDLYLRDGKSIADIKSALGNADEDLESMIEDILLEKEVEEYYEKHISEIDEELEIVQEPNYGRQFPTHIGPIDLLCKSKRTDEYVVIEFKRSQVSDETIGQILRYMGWIYINLSKFDKKVSGIIVGSDYSEKIQYAITGIQSDHIYELLKTKQHPFTTENRPKIN